VSLFPPVRIADPTRVKYFFSVMEDDPGSGRVCSIFCLSVSRPNSLQQTKVPDLILFQTLSVFWPVFFLRTILLLMLGD